MAAPAKSYALVRHNPHTLFDQAQHGETMKQQRIDIRKTCNVVQMAQSFVVQFIQPDDLVLDATAGNGYDTLFLAEQVGDNGLVYAVDCQNDAIEATRKRLNDNSLAHRVSFLHGSHAELHTLLPQQNRLQLSAAMFNLGYLPGSDKTVITTGHTTIHALDTLIDFLAPTAIISIAVYTGHQGGAQEHEMVHNWCAKLPPNEFRSLNLSVLNVARNPPHLYIIYRAC